MDEIGIVGALAGIFAEKFCTFSGVVAHPMDVFIERQSILRLT
jgi:hypothetical protein